MPNRTLALALLSLVVLSANSAARAADFKPCPDAATNAALKGSVCAVETVPADPSGAVGSAATAQPVSLFVRKFPAAGKARGQVWLIAGGPSESGAAFYGMAAKLRDIFPGFDLVMPDQRGTGFSTRMCPVEEAPGSPGGTRLEAAEWATCFTHLHANPATTRQFSGTNAAHDLKRLLEGAPRKGKTYLYGVSYGTQLVLRTVALGAKNIDGVVLDSLVPLQDDEEADLSRRSLVADRVGRQLLADCDADLACRTRLGEPAESIYRRVLARAEKEPQLLAAVPGGNLKQFFGNLLDLPSAARQIPTLIKDIDEGKGDWTKPALAGAKKDMATMGAFPQLPPSTPLAMLISASENDLRRGRTAKDVAAEEAGLLFASSLPGHLANTSMPLYERDALLAKVPAHLPPTLVIHGDRDGKTPHDAAVRHVEALRKAGPVKLYTAERASHWVLWSGDRCAGAEVRKFVLGQKGGARCAPVASSH